jgi:hypothetical protein
LHLFSTYLDIYFEFVQIHLPITFIRKHFHDVLQLRC